MDLSRDELLRYSRHLILPDVGARRTAADQGGARTARRRRRTRLAGRALSRGGGRRHDRTRRLRRRRRVESPAPGAARHGGGRPAQARVGARAHRRSQSQRERRDVRDACSRPRTRSRFSATTTSIVDGTDNFATRYLVNDACVLLGKPNVYGSIFRFDGQASVFCTTDGPCYRCLFPTPPPPGSVPSCAEGGVLGVLPGLVGTIQATEALKLILGAGDPLIGRLLLVDALGMNFRTVRVRRDPSARRAARARSPELIDYDEFCGTSPHHEHVDDDTRSRNDTSRVGRRACARRRPPAARRARTVRVAARACCPTRRSCRSARSPGRFRRSTRASTSWCTAGRACVAPTRYSSCPPPDFARRTWPAGFCAGATTSTRHFRSTDRSAGPPRQGFTSASSAAQFNLSRMRIASARRRSAVCFSCSRSSPAYIW